LSTSAFPIPTSNENANRLETQIVEVFLLGSDGRFRRTQTAEALAIETPSTQPNEIATVFKVAPRR